MAKADVILKAIAKSSRKAAKTNEVVKAARQVAIQNQALQATSETKLLSLVQDAMIERNAGLAGKKLATLEEFQVTQGKLDAAPEPIDLQNFKDLEELKKTRDSALFNPFSDTQYEFQTTNVVEFEKRLNSQFTDPEYATRAAYEAIDVGTIGDKILVDEVTKNLAIEQVFQDKASRAILNNPRVAARAKEWLGDSPYKGRILQHLDRQSDPLRGNTNLDPIQFEEPRQMGNHSGSNEAAIQAALISVERALEQFSKIDTLVFELEGGLNLASGSIHKQIFAALEQHFINHFAIGSQVGKKNITNAELEKMWSAIGNNLTTQANEIGGEAPAVSRNLFRMISNRARQLPTASSTPHLFRGKNGLYLRDAGGFGPEEVSNQLREIFSEYDKVIQSIGLDNNYIGHQKGLQKFIEDRGYDHIIYHNSVEDKGSISIINWNPDLWISLYDDVLQGGSDANRAKAFAAVVMGSMGFGAGAVGVQDGA